ncbi:CDP-diacylglycerol--glycerol-3-phosphate 3-phosphatidyltransferase [Raineyella antarctica]|uniref:Phosphatidylinositol phosphate synthase n=1 Tax=Raineyella antarctica TaxID=1577474 RepID=A0A1G6GPF4_9ACTN|nr:CDP-alcohol phosphatidyltransferase family protein [Raineyella antarctica]SDB83877.1 CDP-diacylglycerol--glycerol-3-phosphate 3-phosphatidyltransferase [Raineyella antarctica]
MLERFRHGWRQVVTPPARLLLSLGISPNAVTWAGTLALVAVAFLTVPYGLLWQGALGMGLLVLSDSIDGQMARLSGRTSRYGAFLDATLDRVSDAAVMTATLVHLVQVGAPSVLVGVAGWALAVGQITSYVKARAEAEGFRADVGIAARADRLVVVLLGLLLAGLGVPWAVEVAVVLLAAAGTVTVAQRLFAVRAQAELLTQQ